jgi:hypothetical protein
MPKLRKTRRFKGGNPELAKKKPGFFDRFKDNLKKKLNYLNLN